MNGDSLGGGRAGAARWASPSQSGQSYLCLPSQGSHCQAGDCPQAPGVSRCSSQIPLSRCLPGKQPFLCVTSVAGRVSQKGQAFQVLAGTGDGPGARLPPAPLPGSHFANKMECSVKPNSLKENFRRENGHLSSSLRRGLRC